MTRLANAITDSYSINMPRNAVTGMYLTDDELRALKPGRILVVASVLSDSGESLD